MSDLRIIVVGAGRVGYHTAAQLADYGHSLVVVERDAQRCEDLHEEHFATVIHGDATRPDVLRQADPGSADVVASLTPNPAENLGICVLAERMNADLRTVVRVHADVDTEAYEDVVDAVIFPERAGARSTANSVVAPDVRTFEELPGDLELLEIRVADGAPVAGRTMADVAFPEGCLIISDSAGNAVATAETPLTAGQTYLVATEPGVADEVQRLFRG